MHNYMSNFLSHAMLMVLLFIVLLSTACSSLTPQPVEQKGVEPKAQALDGDLLFGLLAAEFAGNAGDLEASVGFYQQAARRSTDSRVAARATYIALYDKKYEQTLELLDRWRELEADNPDINRIYAVSYLHLHRSAEALPHVQAVLARDGGSSNKEKAMVVKQLLADGIDAQISFEFLEALNQVQTDNPQMLILQARFAAQLAQYEKSIQLLDRVLNIDASLLDVYLIKAKIYQAQGKLDTAKAMIRQVLKDYPDNMGLRMQYARMLVEDKNYKAAREQYLKVKKKQPDNVEVVLNLALLYIETDQLDEAAELLSHLIELDKKTDIAHYYLGRIGQNKKQYKRAIAHYIEVKKGSYVFQAKLRIASMFAQLDRVDDAIEQLNILIDETDDWANRVRAYITQGEILRKHHRYQDAFDLYSKALSHNRKDVDLLYARALIAEKINRIDIAESDLLKVLSLEPKNPDALNALGYTLADKTKRYKEAKKYIQKAAELVPDDPAVMDSLGWVNYRLGELQEALKWLSMAFEKLVDAEIAAHYGEVLWQANQKDKAREVWHKGQAVDASHPVLLKTLKKYKP